jgi:hypothetical protein
LRLALLTATRSTGGNPILPFVEKATYLLYMLLPVFQPYAERLQTVGETLRATPADWKILLSVGLYALASAGLFYCLSVLAFRRKNLM